MKTLSKSHYVMLSVVSCALAMSVVDGIIQPPYWLKSVIKVLLFLVVPMVYFYTQGQIKGQFQSLFSPGRRDLFLALGLGIGVFVFIQAGYWVITRFFDLSDAILQLTSDGGVSGRNFVWVSTYIALVNSLLEEFMFRGFAFLSLKKLANRKFAYIFSALVFAFYHFGMVSGSHVLILAAAMAGLFIAGVVLNFLNEKSGNIITSWLVHMFANLSINLIGFRVFGLI